MIIKLTTSQTIEEMIQEQIRKEGLKTKPVHPLKAPVLARGHTPIYKMHRYWARRPHNVFAHIIQHYTNPGDLILDPFCGGGVTVVEGLKLRRRVVGVDINPLATWITKVEVEPVDLDELEEAFEQWYEHVKEAVSPLFVAECGKCGKDAQAEWYEWSNVVVCPECGEPVVLAEADKLEKSFQAVYVCTNRRCRTKFKPSGLERLPDKMVAVKTVCDHCDSTDIRTPLPSDFELAEQIERNEQEILKREKLFVPDDPFPDMDRARDDNIFGKGVHYFRDMFTPRQRIAIGFVRSWLEQHKTIVSRCSPILNIFTSCLRFTNKMVLRSEAWRGTNPLEWAGHIYWLPHTYLEVSSLMPLQRRYKATKKGKEQQQDDIGPFYETPNPHWKRTPWNDLDDAKASCMLQTCSSEEIPFLPDGSVDVVITDPPFGGNVQYLELSDFYLVWLKGLVEWGGATDKSREAIETRHSGFEGAKDREHYEELLYRIFKECRRVIKPEGWMVMTFHNREIGVWMALHRAAQRAGFRMPSFEESPNRGLIYQPAIKNYTQTIHQRLSGSLLGDFILSFRPTETPLKLDKVSNQLSLEEEKKLLDTAHTIIRYHGGADERTIWTALMPYLSETGILARVANFNLRQMLSSGPFTYEKVQKKWYLNNMFENGHLRLMDVILAEQFVEVFVYSYLREHKQATMDDILAAIYSKLVNAQMPQLSTINNVIQKYCHQIKVKGEKRDVYVWDPSKKSPQELERIRSLQAPIGFNIPISVDHNDIITAIARSAIAAGYQVHAGKTEQRKSPTLKMLSEQLTGFELGLSPETFSVIKEIDLLVMKNNNLQAGIEVVITMSTANKAINDRFRNLLTVAPNLNVPLFIVVKDEDVDAIATELHKPANVEAGLCKLVTVIKLFELSVPDEEIISIFT